MTGWRRGLPASEGELMADLDIVEGDLEAPRDRGC